MSALDFTIIKKMKEGSGRMGILKTPHGIIETPAFVTVGTKATVKSLSPEEVRQTGAQVVLANTYHLYLQPGEEIVRQAGGLHSFMNWSGPLMTDSGGFQVFSLGAAFGEGVSKFGGLKQVRANPLSNPQNKEPKEKLATIDEDGVTFKSVIDGSTHRFTPEKSMEIQHALGADMFFAFDECTSPHASYEYQKEALERTHRWADRSLLRHKELEAQKTENQKAQALFGVIQGGRFEDLRKESAQFFSTHEFDGFGIGGSFTKDDLSEALNWVTEVLPDSKPRHLLGIGEPIDLFMAVENGIDIFDCVSPTRIARNGTLYTKNGRINILNNKYRKDYSPIDESGLWDPEGKYSKAYLAHLFRAKEMYAATLASIHNLSFIINMVAGMRVAISEDRFDSYKKDFLSSYYKTI